MRYNIFANKLDAFKGDVMNLQYLKAFYVTVQANSISKAAKILHLTQPGLSIQIQSLEKDLGVNLLNRSNKGVELTEAGKIVYDYASAILSLQDNIERDLENLKSDKKRLLLGSCKAIGEYALPCSIYIYKQNNAEVDVNLEIMNTEEVVENLISRSISIGITHGLIENANVKYEKITSNPLILVTSLPLIKDQINLEEFKKLPLIFREKGSGTRDTIERALAQYNIEVDDLNIIYELNSMEAIKSSIIAGKGISFIQELSIMKELKNGVLKRIKIKDLEITSVFYVAYRKDCTLKPFEKDFIRFIKSSKRGFC